jgi:5-methylthioadenosine/S-adenosylhomocysteine deaminase
MKNIDTLINARWVIPVEPEAVVLEHHSVALTEGRILAVLPTAEARGQFKARETVELASHALIPGLVNAHTHAAMSLFRGLADDLPLMDWLQNHIWPAEGKWVSPDFVRDGTRHAMGEMLRGGITCFNDMYFFPGATAQAAEAAGMRAMVGMIALDFPSAYAQDAEEYLHKGLRLHDALKNSPLVARPSRRTRRTPSPTRRWRKSASTPRSWIVLSTCTCTKRRSRCTTPPRASAHARSRVWKNSACSARDCSPCT